MFLIAKNYSKRLFEGLNKQESIFCIFFDFPPSWPDCRQGGQFELVQDRIETSWVRVNCCAWAFQYHEFSIQYTAEMERVLKRVGLSKRTQPEIKAQTGNEPEERVKIRRRRRSKSRRRPSKETKKSRGLFNIDWESVKECKSCKSRAITRRFCSKRCDNELYRSNSFKFERFVRGNEEISTLGKKVSYKAIF